ncbi:MAG TPA: geranylgeranyl reductase family protein [Acidimicrobiales bacterium]|nr:geranylgeranyl reductase family protein [Acidimicrobiales bacterium]
MVAHHEVLVVGGGPAGAACAYWLAEAGHDVLVVEKKRYPREKTCGDGLTPRSVKQLYDMGLADELAGHHRFDGLRSMAFGRTLELRWPDHPDFPSHGYVVTRKDLDHLVAQRAEKAGATVWQECEAVRPRLDGERVTGALVRRTADGGTTTEVEASYVVVADGANSRFGRALGTSRDRSVPMGLAIRGYYESPRHDEPWIESHLDIRDKTGAVLPGYGWIFPVGDGRINVGVGLLSTSKRWKSVNTSHLMDSFAAYAPASWGIRPETSCGAPTGGKLPMAFSLSPTIGPTHLVIGDAGGAINPFNGEGICYAYETGRMAAEAVSNALSTDRRALLEYPERVRAEYELYYKVACAFVKIIGHPSLMRAMVGTGMRSRTLMEWVLRIMANLLRPDELGPAEAAYKAVAAIARLAPGPAPALRAG